MRLAIIGYGSMGQMIEQDALSANIEVTTIIDPIHPKATHKEVNQESLSNCDLVIDYTTPDVIMNNIKEYCSNNINAVIGTTGWYDKLDEVKKLVANSNNRFLWSSNYSIGVQLFTKIIDFATTAINSVEEYDIWGNEIHHKFKKDSPSGTAKTLSQILLNNIDRKNSIMWEMANRQINDDEIHFSSLRGGTSNFEHTIGLDSDADCITIKHAARNRSGYSSGTVKAAQWLFQQSPGYYEMNDFLSSLFNN